MRLNLNKTSLKNKLLKNNLIIFLIYLVYSFILIYLIGTLCFSFVNFELSRNIFDINRWHEMIRFMFLFLWIVLTCLLFSENKKWNF